MAHDEAKLLAQWSLKHQEIGCKRLYQAGLDDCRDWAKAVADEAERHQNECEICKEHEKNCPTCNPNAGEKPQDGEKE